MNYKVLPKIDLHCHLDGSVRPETLFELAAERNIEVPNVDALKELLIAPETCQSLDEYLLRFDLPNQVMQDEVSLERITFELFEDSALENVKYLEVRFGPLLHLLKGLSIKQVLESVLRGMKRAEQQYEITGGIILSVLRTMPKDRIDELLEIGANYLDKGIVAFDLASSEVANFCHEFKPYTDKAIELGYHITIHAGETGVGQNVYDAIELLGAERIGHGIYISNHEEAYELVRDLDIVLEVCPTSNVQTKAVESMSSHPIVDFYKDSLLVTINTDNRTVSDTTMTEEVKKTFETFDMTLEDYEIIYENSVTRAFTSDTIKKELMTYLNDY